MSKKKIQVNIECDEFYVADSLHELASEIENGEREYEEIGGVCGDHYTGSVDVISKKEPTLPHFIFVRGEKYLLLEDCEDTLAMMVMLHQVPVYWIADTEFVPEQVTSPKTIYGASPARFGIKIK